MGKHIKQTQKEVWKHQRFIVDDLFNSDNTYDWNAGLKILLPCIEAAHKSYMDKNQKVMNNRAKYKDMLIWALKGDKRINKKIARDLAHGLRGGIYGVVRGYWENEIAKIHDIYDLIKMRGGHSEFNVGRERLATYMIKRIGYGSRTGQSYTTQRGWEHYHGNDEASNMDLMISAMVGIGLLKKVDVSNIYELTSEAFALLKKPKWHERYAELLSWVSIVAMFLSIILMLRELGIV